MSNLSFASTKQGVSIVHTNGKKNNFEILNYIRIVTVPCQWVQLAKSIDSIVQSRRKAAPISSCIIVKAGSGMYAASPDTYKAEGFVEYVLGSLGLHIEYISKQSLAKALGCAKKEKWQQKAAVMFNSNKNIKGFSQGFDAACAGAWSAAS